MSKPRRLAPERPFPPYSFVPGKSPHPKSGPAGHSYGVESPPPAPLDPAHWSASRPYLYGLDLFNHQFYWEAHEQFEALWLAAGRAGPVADFLKALIKLAAAGVKHLEQQPQGVKSHAGRAGELLRELTRSRGDSPFLGFALGSLIELADRAYRNGWPDSPPLLLPIPISAADQTRNS